MPRTARVRFAPSPTGFVHLGSARTTLFDYLFARKHGGIFVLRLEDTDVERNRIEYEANLYEGLRWLGLHWDEGPDVGGPFAPYRQSERLDLYREAAAGLLRDGKAYRCYCTPEELAAERAAAEAEHRPYTYSRRCLSDPPRHRDEFTVRFRVPDGVRVEWDDLVRGPIAFESDAIGDFIIVRTSGTPLYNFSVAVDDVGMEITHVFRAEEHISNTPRQLLLLDALGYERPAYGHLPMVVGADRSKLSKRKHPEARLELFRERGYLPEAMVNYLALLGWNPGTEQEVFSLEELELVFDMGRVQKGAAQFDWQKLDWLNGHYIRALSPSDLAARLAPFVPELDAATLERAVPALQERLPRLAEARELLQYLWNPPEPAALDADAAAKVRAARDALAGAEWTPEAVEAALDAVREANGWSRNALFKPLRQVLTGGPISPPIHYTVALLDRADAFRRMDTVLG